MKCARCEHQWRLLPEHAMEEAAEETGEQDAVQPQAPAEHHGVFARAAVRGHDEDQDRWNAASHQEADDRQAEAPTREEPADEPSWASRFSPGFGAGFGRPIAPATPPHAASTHDHWHGEASPEEAEAGPEDDLPSLASWRTGRESFGSPISTLSDTTFPDYGAPEDTDEAEVRIDTDSPVDDDWAREAKERLAEDKWRDAGTDDRVEIFGGAEARFQKFPQPEAEVESEPEPEETAASESGGSWASRLMRLRQSPFRKRSRSEPEENTESDIRHALNAALEQPDDGPGAKSPFQKLTPERFGGHAEQDTGGAPEESFLRFSDHLNRLDQENRDDPDFGQGGRFGFGAHGQQPSADEDAEEQPPFRLTGQHARAPIFGTARDLDEEANLAASADETYGVDEFQNELNTAFGAAKAHGALDFDGDTGREAHIETREDFRLYDDRYEGEDDGRDPHLALNEDLAALQSELESTDVANYEREYVPQGGGGLAVVAAWAVFVSVISGVMLAIITFRQDIMTAMPGTASLYQALGFEVTHPGVDFADVSYRWRTADGKPMIEVTGQVVNTTGRTVIVPRVLVNVRDAGGGDAVTATASVPTQELAPHERASFSLEFMSPPADVAQIELEFDNNR